MLEVQMNRWGLSKKVQTLVKKRDKKCVYCRRTMRARPHARGVPTDKATVEHINNVDRDNQAWNVALCCGGCNTSKGAKQLLEWFQTDYCKKNKISGRTVAPAVRNWLKNHRSR
jgi:5-methylcytosine-specific restriction endonuclease McrA